MFQSPIFLSVLPFPAVDPRTASRTKVFSGTINPGAERLSLHSRRKNSDNETYSMRGPTLSASVNHLDQQLERSVQRVSIGDRRVDLDPDFLARVDIDHIRLFATLGSDHAAGLKRRSDLPDDN